MNDTLNRSEVPSRRMSSHSRRRRRSSAAHFLTRKRLVDIGELPVQQISERRHVSQSGELHVIMRILKDENVEFLLRGLAARALGNLMLDECVQELVRTDKELMASLVQLVATEPSTAPNSISIFRADEKFEQEKKFQDKADVAVVKVHCYFLISMILHWSSAIPRRPDTHGRSRNFNINQDDELQRPLTANSQMSFLQSFSHASSETGWAKSQFSAQSGGLSDRPQSQRSLSRRHSLTSENQPPSWGDIAGKRPRTTGTNAKRSRNEQASTFRAKTPGTALIQHENFKSRQQGLRRLLNTEHLSSKSEIDSIISRISLPAPFGSNDQALLVADIHRPSTAEMISVGLSTPPGEDLEMGNKSDINFSTSKKFFSALGTTTNRILLSRGRSRGKSRGSIVVHPTIKEEHPRKKNHIPGQSSLFKNLPFTYPSRLPERYQTIQMIGNSDVHKPGQNFNLNGVFVPGMLKDKKITINLNSLHDMINDDIAPTKYSRNNLDIDDQFSVSHKEQLLMQHQNEKLMMDDALMMPSHFLEQKGAHSMACRRAALDLINMNKVFLKRMLKFGIDSWIRWSRIHAEKQIAIRTGVLTLGHVYYRHELIIQWHALQMLERHAIIARQIEELRAVLRIQNLYRHFRRYRRTVAITKCQRWYRQRKRIQMILMGLLSFLNSHRKALQIQQWFRDTIYNWNMKSLISRSLEMIRNATIRIQRWYVNYESSRMFMRLIKLGMETRSNARIKIQSLGRMIISKNVLAVKRIEFQNRERAALKLQVFIRIVQGAFSTHMLLRALHYSDIHEYEEERSSAATNMQRVVRGHLGRKIYRLKALYRRTKRRSACRIEEFWFMMVRRKQSAIKVQSFFRGVQSRKVTDYMLKLFRFKHKCAKQIQYAWLRTPMKQRSDVIIRTLIKEYPKAKISKLLVQLRVKVLKRKLLAEIVFFGRHEKAALDISWAWYEYKRRCRWLILQREALKRERREEGMRTLERIAMSKEDRLSQKYSKDLKIYSASSQISSIVRANIARKYTTRLTVQMTVQKLSICVHVYDSFRRKHKCALMIQNFMRQSKARRICNAMREAMEMKRRQKEMRKEEEKMRLRRLAQNRMRYAIMLQQAVRRHQANKELKRRKKGLLYASANRFSKCRDAIDVVDSLAEAIQSTRGFNPVVGDQSGMGIYLWLFRMGSGNVLPLIDEYNELQLKKNKPTISRPEHLLDLLRPSSNKSGRTDILKKTLGITDRNDINYIHSMLFPTDGKHINTVSLFKRIGQRKIVEDLFLKAYPSYGGRSKKFKHHLPVYPPDRCAPAVDFAVSELQLVRYFSTYKGKSMTALKRVKDLLPKCICADDCVDCICGGRRVLHDKKFEHQRKMMTRGLYVSALKQIATIVGGKPLPKDIDDGFGELHENVKSSLLSSDTIPDSEKAVNEMHDCVSKIEMFDIASRTIQRVFRGKIGRKKAFIRKIDIAYQEERKENKVLKYWEKERAREESEYARQEKEKWEAQEKEYVDELIAKIPRHGWIHIPERFAQSYYWNKFTKEKQTECPVYSYEEYSSTRKIQSVFRGYRFRKIAQTWKERNLDANDRIKESSKLLRFVDAQGYEVEQVYEEVEGDSEHGKFKRKTNNPPSWERVAPEIRQGGLDILAKGTTLRKDVTCSRCRDEVSDRYCDDCKKYYCFHCFTNVHDRRGTSMSKHKSRMINAFDLSSEDSMLCSKCNSKNATRFCLGCTDVSKRLLCDVCFQISHQCSDCSRSVATIYCESCEAEYCESCFVLFHNKGNRTKHKMKPSKHGWIGFSSSTPPFCSECLPETYTVATTHCKSCDDFFCTSCCKSFHMQRTRSHEQVLLGKQPSAPPRPMLTKESIYHYRHTPYKVYISIQQPAHTGNVDITILNVYLRETDDENEDHVPFIAANVQKSIEDFKIVEKQLAQKREIKENAQKACTAAIETSCDQKWINSAKQDLKNAEKKLGSILVNYMREKMIVDRLQKFAFKKVKESPVNGMCVIVEIDNLQPNSTYHVCATASNVNGEGPMSSRCSFTTRKLIKIPNLKS